MKTYSVTPYNSDSSYTVTLDDSGILSVDGLPDHAVETLLFSMRKYTQVNGLNPVIALHRSVGLYSTIEEVRGNSVAD